MQKKGANISLKGYDDIFSTDQSRAEAQQERVQEIPLSELHPFEGHPFRVVDDEEMMKTAESVRDFGVLTPAIVRPDPDGGYEIVSGHRRHRASELAGKETMPAIVRDLDDDAAIILMVDANLQRESILPSERAFAYKMKLDAIKHQGQRTDLTSSQVGMKLQAMDIVGQEAGESRNQVHRYIRLTELIPELLDMVDTGQIKFNPAVELSYLASEEQKDFLSAMDYAQAAPSLSQAQRIKKLAQEGECTLDAMCEIMNEIKKGELDRVTFKTDIQNRLVCFDIKELGNQLKKIGMLIVQDQVWGRVTANRSAGKSTRYYIDEFHLLLKEEQTATYSVEIWKRFRKWGGLPTGITQNVKDLLRSPEIANILENSDFIYMLNQASDDRSILAQRLNISPHQLSYVTNSGEGEGLLFYGNVILPFIDRFPTDLELYRIMTTKLNEVAQEKEA